MKNEFKIGDKVRCLPASKIDSLYRNDYYGAGYIEEKEFIINMFNHSPSMKKSNTPTIPAFPEGGNGVFLFALEIIDPIQNDLFINLL